MSELKHNMLIGLLLTLILSTGCVEENMEDCPTGKYVCFETVMQKYDYKDVVENTTLYLYDDTGNLVEEYYYTSQQIKDDGYRLLVPMQPDGTYTVLASSHGGRDYSTGEHGQLSRFEVGLLTDNADTVRRAQQDLHYAWSQTMEFTSRTRVYTEYETMKLYKNTNNINVDIIYDGYSIPENCMARVNIKANNAAHDYLNVCAGDSYLTYLPLDGEAEDDADESYAFKTMHVKTTTDITFTMQEYDFVEEVVNGFYELSISDEILKIYKTDDELDQEDVFNIDLVIDEGMKVVEVKVNGWYTVRQGEEV